MTLESSLWLATSACRCRRPNEAHHSGVRIRILRQTSLVSYKDIHNKEAQSELRLAGVIVISYRGQQEKTLGDILKRKREDLCKRLILFKFMSAF